MRRALLALLLALVTSCESSTGLDLERLEVLQVAAVQVDCMGLVPQKCLQVRTDDNEPWRRLYDGIEGFTHTEGFEYTLRVALFRVKNPPADGSSRQYRLVRELRRVAVPPT